MIKFNFSNQGQNMGAPITSEFDANLQNIGFFRLGIIQFQYIRPKFDIRLHYNLKRPLEADLNFISKLKIKTVFCYISLTVNSRNLISRAN